MKPIFLLLGALFILVLFNVGESNLRNSGLQKTHVLFFIAIELFCLTLPPYEIAEINFTIGGFLLPFLVSILFLCEVKNKKYIKKIIFSFLTVVFLMQLFFLIQPYLPLESVSSVWFGAILIFSILCLVICHYPKQAFVPFFWGIIFSQMALNHTNIVGVDLSDLIILGNETMLFGFLIGIIFMFFIYNIFYSIKRKQQAKSFINHN